jgi:isopenicillin N synthase-like dioxygenase
MGSKGTGIDIPVVDIRPGNREAARQVLDAATNYGFVFIENNDTGIDVKDIDHMFDLSQKFFASPEAEKDEVSIRSNKAGKNHGYLSQGVEKLDPATQKRPDVKESVVDL